MTTRVRLRVVLLAAALLCVVAPPAPAQEVVVSFPPDRTLVESSDLSVEGQVKNAAVDEVEIVVNDGRPVRAVVRDTIFVEEVELDEGLNTVRVGTQVRSVWYDGGRDKPPPEFTRVYGHVGLSDGCLECHAVQEGALVLAGTREEICVWCHGDLVRGRIGVAWTSVHAPVGSGACLSCHGPHTSRKKGLPAEKAPQCADCHAAVAERLKTDRFVHGPMNLGDCRLCHAVHASAEPRLLVRPATALCTDCHSEALPPPGTAAELQPHTMIPQGRCGGCHEPHSSMNPRMLREPAGRLCQGCHEGKTRSFHESKGFSIYVCAKCHDLHRPTQRHLIIDASRSLCTECHDFRDEQAKFTHSFVAAGACFNCHAFHEASLPGDVATTCLGCHRDNPQLPGAHRGLAFERSRCTSCHQPHQSRVGKLLREVEHPPFASRECNECHRERAAAIGPVYRSLCIGCHGGLDLATLPAAPAEVHPPFRDEDCSRCHLSHNSATPGVLRAPQGSLCLSCHRALRKLTLLTPVSAHSAVVEGRCTDCHEPHFTANAGLLKKPQNQLCPSCHGAVVAAAGGEAWPVAHKPVAEGKCRLCHRHHSAGNADLLKAPSPQTCRPCHVELFAGMEDIAVRSRHAPVAKGDCGACHEIHGSRGEHLLKPGGGEALCRGCHPSPKGTHHRYLSEPQGVAVLGTGERCTRCHVPHASREKRLLLPSTSPVCAGCHKM